MDNGELFHNYSAGHTFMGKDGQEWVRIEYIINGFNIAFKKNSKPPYKLFLVQQKDAEKELRSDLP